MIIHDLKDDIMSASNRAITVANTSLLILVSTLLFIVPVFQDKLYSLLTIISFTAIFVLIGFVVKMHRKIVYALALPAITTEWLAHLLDFTYIEIISLITTILLFEYVVIQLILQIVRSKEVNAGVIIGAINGYLLAGMGFCLIMGLIHAFDPESFGFKGQEINFADYSYFGLVTFSTLGYGDIVPLKPLAKSIVTLTTISGQIYLAVIIALLVGKFASTDQGKENKEDITS